MLSWCGNRSGQVDVLCTELEPNPSINQVGNVNLDPELSGQVWMLVGQGKKCWAAGKWARYQVWTQSKPNLFIILVENFSLNTELLSWFGGWIRNIQC